MSLGCASACARCSAVRPKSGSRRSRPSSPACTRPRSRPCWRAAAPRARLYHAPLARDLARPLAVLNLGGGGNVTWIGADDSLLAFDTGPGNALLDDWVRRHTGALFDADGALARGGQAQQRVIDALL